MSDDRVRAACCEAIELEWSTLQVVAALERAANSMSESRVLTVWRVNCSLRNAGRVTSENA